MGASHSHSTNPSLAKSKKKRNDGGEGDQNSEEIIKNISHFIQCHDAGEGSGVESECRIEITGTLSDKSDLLQIYEELSPGSPSLISSIIRASRPSTFPQRLVVSDGKRGGHLGGVLLDTSVNSLGEFGSVEAKKGRGGRCQLSSITDYVAHEISLLPSNETASPNLRCYWPLGFPPNDREVSKILGATMHLMPTAVKNKIRSRQHDEAKENDMTITGVQFTLHPQLDATANATPPAGAGGREPPAPWEIKIEGVHRERHTGGGASAAADVCLAPAAAPSTLAAGSQGGITRRNSVPVLPPRVAVISLDTFTLEGKGQHRTLHTLLTLRERYPLLVNSRPPLRTEDDNFLERSICFCAVQLMYVLPPEVFVDSDEIGSYVLPLVEVSNSSFSIEGGRGLSRSVRIAQDTRPLSFMDIEKPAYDKDISATAVTQSLKSARVTHVDDVANVIAPDPQRVIVNGVDTFDFKLPVHIRYGAPCPAVLSNASSVLHNLMQDEGVGSTKTADSFVSNPCTDTGYAREFLVAPPRVTLDCVLHTTHQGEWPAVHHFIETGAPFILARHAVGSESHYFVVIFVTVLISVLCSLYLYKNLESASKYWKLNPLEGGSGDQTPKKSLTPTKRQMLVGGRLGVQSRSVYKTSQAVYSKPDQNNYLYRG